MLKRRNDMFFVCEGGITLEALNCGDTHTRYQVRIFAIRFLDAAPARLTCDVDHGCQCLVCPSRTGLFSGHLKESADEVGVKGCAETDGLRETRGVNGGLTVQAFFMKYDRNTQPAVFHKEFLNIVGQFSHLSGILTLSGVAGPANLTQAVVTVPEMFFGLFKVKVTFVIYQCLGLILPYTEHLGDFLLKRHLGKKVFDSLFDR
jgi:hypothetical protein